MRRAAAIVTFFTLGGLTACGSSTLPARGATTPATTAVATSSATPTSSPTAAPVGTAGFTLGTATARVAGTNDETWVPSTVTVHAGQIVEWDVPVTAEAHNVVFPGHDALSNVQGIGAKPNGTPGDPAWQVRFTVPGTYQFVCTWHPGMSGTLTVLP